MPGHKWETASILPPLSENTESKRWKEEVPLRTGKLQHYHLILKTKAG